MKIRDIKTKVLVRQLDGTQRNPRFTWTSKQTLLVFVLTDEGVTGVGEAWSDAGAASSIEAFIENDVKPILVGADAGLVEHFASVLLDRAIVSTRRSQTAAALSAIDIALWDIKGKEAGQPVWRLLGGNDRKVLPYASGGLYAAGQTPEDLGREFAGYVERGFRGVKIKVGGAPLALDVARVAAVRAAIGHASRLMVDAVSNYDVPRAVNFARAAAPHDIYWFEQPVAITDIEGQARVHAQGGIPVAGNENEYGLQAYRRLIEAGAVHYVQADAIISGGITGVRKIATLAEAFSLPVTLHHSNSIVSMAANMHLAASIANCDSIEYHVLHQPLFDCAPAGLLDIRDGYIAVPDRPGLGIDLEHLLP
jgi:L-alanine-DL-glutamate epimerase-like enolase superfamily enzyme